MNNEKITTYTVLEWGYTNDGEYSNNLSYQNFDNLNEAMTEFKNYETVENHDDYQLDLLVVVIDDEKGEEIASGFTNQ